MKKPPRHWILAKEVAEILGIQEATVKRHREMGNIRCYERVGKIYLYYKGEIEAFKERRYWEKFYREKVKERKDIERAGRKERKAERERKQNAAAGITENIEGTAGTEKPAEIIEIDGELFSDNELNAAGAENDVPSESNENEKTATPIEPVEQPKPKRKKVSRKKTTNVENEQPAATKPKPDSGKNAGD